MNLSAVKDIQSINAVKPGGWFFDGSYALESLPLLANVQSVTTNMSYKQNFWKYLDPQNQQQHVYDRSAHIMGDISKTTGVELPEVNKIKINLNPCDEHVVKELNISYIVMVNGGFDSAGFSDYVDKNCMSLIKTEQTKGFGDLKIYRITDEEK
jgi:hypothetical protein